MQPLSQDSNTVKEEAMTTLATGTTYRGPDLYEFLVEAELQHYYNALSKELKVNTVPQLKYVEDDDMRQIGMSKPEMRRLKKYFHKYCPQTYLRRIKKIFLHKKDESDRPVPPPLEPSTEKAGLKLTSRHMISADSITINKELGSGEFGIVQQGVWTNEEGIRIQVAIKRLSKEKMQNNSMDFLKEASIMHSIDTEHIVRLYGVVLEADALMLVTELAPLRSLLECLKEPALRPSFPVISLCEFALQICDGMRYLENKRLIHRDLAARNILVFSKNKVKISDFGLSRALGVGKNYYQTNFNVNLKLPIAWCAPECINYLRFTSASDVWAYGVTLWEMFSYGFQPWAALTGQQILEAIDEPKLHRLEQPECCPKDYYALMLRCWQHDPNKRPKFDELMTLLPDSKPEQVLAIKDYEEASSHPKSRREFLFYKINDIITVLDKKAIPDNPALWKGALNNGKTGLFNPANTVAYLGTDIPSMKPSFVRPDGKRGLYSSGRRLRPDMISRPQGDFKHTGHVGLDGAFFGDVSFLGDKYSQLPKQIVTPYKPQEDQEQSSFVRTLSDSSDRAPLIAGSSGKGCPASDPQWVDGSAEESRKMTGPASARRSSESASSCGLTDHEYHEISEEEDREKDAKFGDSPTSEAFFQKQLDFGPSLMDEVFTALHHCREDANDTVRDEDNNVRNEIREMAFKVDSINNGGHHRDSTKKKHNSVKPISPSDAKTIESAIAIAEELAANNMRGDSISESDAAQDSPRTPSSPNKRKFSFRFPVKTVGSGGSPKGEKRNFAEEAASIPNIQESLTESAKEAYNSLVEKRHFESTTSLVEEETNPLRMLRNSSVPVRPKVRGNKHGTGSRQCNAQAPTTLPPTTHDGHSSAIQSQSMENVRLPSYGSQNSACSSVIHSTLPRSSAAHGGHSQNTFHTLSSPDASGVSRRHLSESSGPPPTASVSTGISSASAHTLSETCHPSAATHTLPSNMLPLPPRDRTKPMPAHKPRQRKHPLIIPSGKTRNLVKPSLSSSLPDVNPVSAQLELGSSSDTPSLSPLSPSDLSSSLLTPTETLSTCSSPRHEVFLDSRLGGNEAVLVVNGTATAPAKPPRLHNLDDSFDGQIQADMDSLDDIPEEEAPVPPMYRNSDHVSCEDLLDFALDFPNAKRTQGRARGMDSDEVRIMQKVLKGEVNPEECVGALNETDWDVHKAIKYLKLQLMLNDHLISIDNCKQTLMSCSWDVQKAYNYLMATYGIVEDSTEV